MSLSLITEPVINSLILIQFNNTDDLISQRFFWGEGGVHLKEEPKMHKPGILFDPLVLLKCTYSFIHRVEKDFIDHLL